MSKKVSVILLEDVAELGQAGDIIAVSEGYARNFLFLEGKAALATDSARAKKKADEDAHAKERAAATAAAQELAQTLDGTELTLRARVKDGTEIFGRITKKQITDELNKQAKLKLATRQVDLEKPITATGSQDVTIHLADDVTVTIRVTVEDEQ